MTLDLTAILVIIGCMSAVIWAGVRGGAGRTTGMVDYALAGRRITISQFVATLIATWYGLILGNGEFSYRYGVVTWLCLCVPYYVVGFLYSRTLARSVRNASALSIPEQIGLSYGRAAGLVATVLTLVISVPAMHALTVGTLVTAVTGWPLWLTTIGFTAVSLVYVYRGGLKADIAANKVQVILMYGAFIVLLTSSIASFGAPSIMWAALPATHRSFADSLSWQVIVVWWLIALQTFIDPAFHIRVAAGQNAEVSRRGILWSILGWVIFDLLTVTSGLYAAAFVVVENPLLSYFSLAEQVLSSAGKGLFVAGVLAAVMATIDGYALVSASMIGHDLLGHRRDDGPDAVRAIQRGLLATGVAACVLALLVPSIVDILFHTSSVIVPALFLPLLLSFTRHRERLRSWSVSIILLPALLSIVWILVRTTTPLGASWTIWHVEPMIVGLLASAFLISGRMIATRT
jgi:SSS family solute:Na+ symporter